MKNKITTLALTAVLAAWAIPSYAQISFGIRIGEPPAPHAYRVPPRPGPDYVWIEGYNYPENGRYVWHDGYWTRPPYAGAYWVEPYHDGQQYYQGHWEGDHGVVMHDHHWDRGNQRDENRWRDNNRRPDQNRREDQNRGRDENRGR
jgi:hypothetical protein